MIRLLTAFTLCAGLALSSNLTAHGGVYIGPGDVVPPGAAPPDSPTTPTTPTSPTTPTTPVSPLTPGGTPTTDPSTPIPPAIPTQPPNQSITPASAQGVDLTRWEFWWEFNKSHFLNLRVKVHTSGASTGESDIMQEIGQGAAMAMTSAPTHAQKINLIIPQLRELVEAVDNRDIAGGGMMALAKIQLDPSVSKLFKRYLKSPDQEVAETAALAFGVLQDATALPLLLALAEDTPEGRSLTGKPNGVPARTRTFALYGLGLLGASTNDAKLQLKITDKLWDILTSDQSSYKDLRAACVISMGVIPFQDPTRPVENLLAYLNDGNNDTLVRAHCPNAIAKILAATGTSAPFHPLIQKAVENFAQYCQGRKVKNEIQQSCVYAMGMLVNPSEQFPIDVAYAAITHVAENSRNKQAKNYTAIAMAHLGAQTGDASYRERAVRFLSDNMRKAKGGYDAWCGLGLGVMSFYVSEQGGAMPSIVERGVVDKFIGESNQQRKGAYAVSLGLMRAEIAKEDLRQAIDQSRDDAFLGYACLSLGMIGAGEYKDFLAEMVANSVRKPDLLKQASIGLGLLRDKGVVDQLIGLIQPDDQRKPSLAVLSAAATAIGFIGDKSSVSPLVQTMTDRNMTPLARAFAAIALGAVADANQLPWNSIYSRDLNYRASVPTLTNQASGVLDIL